MSSKRLFTWGITLVAALFLWASRPVQPAHAASCLSQGTGNWGAASTWLNCGGLVPQNGDDVTIATGHTVTVNTNTNTLNSLTVNGTMVLGDSNVARTVTVSGFVLVNSGGTIEPRGVGTSSIHQFFVGGNFTNNGSFLIGAGNPRIDTTFNGTAPQTISGTSVAAFYNLTVNSGATVVFPSSSIPTVANAMVNNGTVQQTRLVNSATVLFLTISTDRFRGVDITTAANLGNVTVSIKHVTGQTCTDTGGSSPAYALRCYEITPTNQGAATVTLWALDSERNSIPVANLVPYRYVVPNWIMLTALPSGTGTNNYVFGRGNTTGFSSFLLGGNLVPTAVRLNQPAVSLPSSSFFASLIATAMLFLLTGWQLHSRRKDE